MILLSDHIHAFPSPYDAPLDQDIIAIGGDLDPQRLLLGYSLGLFPWYNHGETPILWQSPHPRFILFPDQVRVNRSLRRSLNRGHFTVTFDQAFERVLGRCAEIPRAQQEGTWLNPELIESLTALHYAGYVHSAETWCEGELVGGLYGLTLGGIFIGESMFADVSDASKVAFVHTARRLTELGYQLIDCQAYTDNLARFGAFEIHRERFLDVMRDLLRVQPSAVWPT